MHATIAFALVASFVRDSLGGYGGKSNGQSSSNGHDNGRGQNGHGQNAHDWTPVWEIGQPFVLDDSEASVTRMTSSTLASCLSDAHDGAFHQSTSHKGKAYYEFEPSEDGCYVIEEWHPGSDDGCSRHMSSEVKLEAITGKGWWACKYWTYVDQSLNGGRWNVLGAMPFYQGGHGKLKVKIYRGAMSKCQTGNNCMWGADAFRIRRVSALPEWGTGRGCKVPEVLLGESQMPNTTFMTTTLDAAETTRIQEMSTTVGASISLQGQMTSTAMYDTTAGQEMGTTAAASIQQEQTTSAAIYDTTARGETGTTVGASIPQEQTTSAATSDTTIAASIPQEQTTSTAIYDTTAAAQEMGTTIIASIPQEQTTPAAIHSTTAIAANLDVQAPVVQELEQLAQTIVDDVDAVFHTAWQRHGMDSKSPWCGVQGWKQRFLFLDPLITEETEAPATFTFNPPEDGCYLVEEFHPASICDKQLSSLVQVTVEYDLDQKAHATLDQTRFGNQWNSVALLPFSKGRQGKVVVNHPQVNQGVAAADAFRFTRLSSECAAAPAKLVDYVRLSQHPVSVTIDDRYASTEGATVSSGCDRTALDATLHASTESHASATFTFVPPSTGCFRIDEFHPETDSSCILAAEAGVQVDHGIGQSWQGSFSLAAGGGRWNSIGHFPFYAGIQGSITSRKMGKDMWVADGFRLTKVSDSCSQRPHTALVTLRMHGVDLETSGSLGGDFSTHADLRIALHEALEESPTVLDQNVRLIGLRRGSIISEFELTGSRASIVEAMKNLEADMASPENSKVGKAMCEAAIAATVGIDSESPVQCHGELMRTDFLEGVERSTEILEPVNEASIYDSDNTALAMLLIVGGCAGFLTVLAGALIVRKRRRRRHANNNAIKTKEVDSKDCKYGNDTKDNVSECGSTLTPSSKVSCEVQTEVTGDISEIGSQASRENTHLLEREWTCGLVDDENVEHNVNLMVL